MAGAALFAVGTTATWKIDAYLGFVLQLPIGFGLAMPPPPDVASQMEMAIPLYLLYD